MSLQSLTDAIVAFRDERDWEQFHTPKNLAAAISIEAAELQELYLWEEKGSTSLRRDPERAAEEIADVLIFALLFCHQCEIDPEKAIRRKLELNRERYPIEQSRGRSLKHTELGDS